MTSTCKLLLYSNLTVLKLILTFMSLGYSLPASTQINPQMIGMQIRLKDISNITFKNNQNLITKESVKLNVEAMAVVKNSVIADKMAVSYCSHTCTYTSFTNSYDVLLESFFQEYKVIKTDFSIHEDRDTVYGDSEKVLRIKYYGTEIESYKIKLSELIQTKSIVFFDYYSLNARKAQSIILEYNSKVILPTFSIKSEVFKIESRTSTQDSSSRLERAIRNTNLN